MTGCEDRNGCRTYRRGDYMDGEGGLAIEGGTGRWYFYDFIEGFQGGPIVGPRDVERHGLMVAYFVAQLQDMSL